jgi:thiol-disulfide isomerase/thioredoxin
MRNFRTIFAAGALLLSVAGASAAPRVGNPAPPFVGQTLDGQAFDLGALRGHVVIVNLWATWCPPCRAEMPMLDAFYKAHQGEGLALIGLSADRRRDLDEVRKAMGGLGYPAALLSGAKTNGFGSPGVLPITYVIDAGGKVAAVLNGADAPLTAAALADAVASAGPPKR